MNGLRKKCENLHFWAFWAKNANFEQFLAKIGETRFCKKSNWNIFSAFTIPNKLHSFRKKVMNGFPERLSRTDGRPNGGTNERTEER